MRLGKEQAAGYVADVETDEIPETALTAPVAASEPEPVISEPEKAAAAG